MSIQSMYATVDQLVALSLTPAAAERFIPNGDNSFVVANLQAASSMADQYLASQFDLPLIEWNMALTQAVCDIAAKRLYTQFGYNPNNGPSVDRNIQTRYEEAMVWLEKVSKQEVFPNFIDGSSLNPKAGPFVISNPEIGFASVSTSGFGGDFNNG